MISDPQPELSPSEAMMAAWAVYEKLPNIDSRKFDFLAGYMAGCADGMKRMLEVYKTDTPPTKFDSKTHE